MADDLPPLIDASTGKPYVASGWRTNPDLPKGKPGEITVYLRDDPKGRPASIKVDPGEVRAPAEILSIIDEAADKYGVPRTIARAIAQQESSFNPDLVGAGNDTGLFQILPSTAKAPGYGVEPVDPDKLLDARTNADFAMRYLVGKGKSITGGELDWSNPRHTELAVRAYNGGGDPDYIRHVMRYAGGSDLPPIVGSDKYQFSPDAIPRAQKSGADVVYMSPRDYLDLVPNTMNPRSDTKGRSLAKSLAKGDQVTDIPTLDIEDGKVVDQDGAHRAQFAMDAGIERIPVAIKRTGGGPAPKEVIGMSGRVLPWDFQPVQKAPEPKSFMQGFGQRAGDTLVGALQTLAVNPYPIPGQRDEPMQRAQADLARIQSERTQQYEGERAAAGQTGTDWGGVAADVATTIPLAMLSPGRTAAGVGERILTQAVPGMFAGASQPGTGAERVTNAAIGGGLGVAGGAVVEGVAKAVRPWMKAVTSPIYDLVSRVVGTDVRKNAAAQKIIRRMEQDAAAGGPTAQDIIDLANAAGDKPLTLADLAGENTRALAGGVARAPGESREIMTRALTERDVAAGARLSADVDRAFGKVSRFDAAKALAQARATAAGPKYEAAFSRIQVTPEEAARVQRFVADRIGQDAMQKGLRVIELEHLATDTPFNPADFGVKRGEDGKFELLGDFRNLRLMDAVKRGYDEIVEGFRDPTSGRLNLDQYGNAVNQVRAAYVADLRAMFPRYGAALDAWGGPSQSLDALAFGRDALRQEPEAIRDRLLDMKPGDREFARLGLASTLRKAMGKTGASGNEARAIIGNKYTQDQIRPFFATQEEYDRFINSVTAESKMFSTKYDVLGNSKTAARLAEDDSPAIEGATRGASAVANAAHGNIFGFVGNAMRSLNAFNSLRDPAVNANIATYLTRPISQASPVTPSSQVNNYIMRKLMLGAPVQRNALADAIGKARAVGATGAQRLLAPSQQQ